MARHGLAPRQGPHATGLAILLLGEHVTVPIVAGTVLTVLGVFLITAL